jgi:hypothetical protein
MCSLQGADQGDCQIDLNSPSTWAINKIDVKAFAEKLTKQLGGSQNNVILLNDQSDIDAGLEALKSPRTGMTIQSVSYSIDGGSYISGTVSGKKILLPKLPANRSIELDVMVTSQGNKIKFPLQITTQKVKKKGKTFTDKEMHCSDVIKPKTENPETNLKNLQGGSASCGVVGKGFTSMMSLLILVLPLLLIAMRKRTKLPLKTLATGLIALPMILTSSPSQAKDGGLNSLQYRPVNDGIGVAESGSNISKNSLNAGLYMDYSNDAVELADDENTRIKSVVDDMVTAHAVFNYGITSKFTLGVHIPYVQKSDLERSMDGYEKAGGDLGQLSDVSLLGKYSLTSKRTFAAAVVPVLTLPTGNPDLLIGDGTASAPV